MEVLSGYIEQIIYRIPDTGYTVFSLDTEAEQITCVGMFRYADEGEFIEVTGDYVNHKTYGRQFDVKQYKIKEPDSISDIERYLSSGAIKGIGPALANRIIKEFGKDTLSVIEHNPEKLVIVKGITENKARDISIQFIERREFREVLVFFFFFLVGLNLAGFLYVK